MIDFLQRLRQRKLVQWTLAYVAGAFTVIQAVDVVAAHFEWSPTVMRYLILALMVGLFVVLALTWYHGERGAQRVGGPELMIIALLLVIGGIVVKYAGRENAPRAVVAARGVPARAATVAAHAAPSAITPPRAQASPVSLQAPIPPKSVAVLPFENLSNDKSNAYFVAGMQELILTRLADIGDLKVISRISTMKYQSRPDNLKRVAAELGVATILEGSVQKQGRQVLINVRLIDAQSDTHLWAETYPRTLTNIFGVEGEVAQRVAHALDARLDAVHATRLAAVPTTNTAAFDLFLRAEYESNHGVVHEDVAGWKHAVDLYRKALIQDPTFALAYARLSWNESVLGLFGGGGEDVPTLHRQARVDAVHALRLRPDLPAGHVALGFSDMLGRHDYATALKSFATALVLRPNYADALSAQGLAERGQRRYDAAIESFARAVSLDPRNYFPTYHLGVTYAVAGRYADAEPWYRRTVALQPDSTHSRIEYAYVIVLGTGDIPRAQAQVQGDAPALKAMRARLLVYQRKFAAAITLLDGIPATAGIFGTGSLKDEQLAVIQWQAGNLAQARTLFAKTLSVNRATLANTRGVEQASMWNVLGRNQIGAGQTRAGLAAIAKSEAILAGNPGWRHASAVHFDNARAYVMAGRADLAVPLLAKVMVERPIGFIYSPPMLWIDPWWDPIRSDPRFQKLLVKYAGNKPPMLASVPGA